MKFKGKKVKVTKPGIVNGKLNLNNAENLKVENMFVDSNNSNC